MKKFEDLSKSEVALRNLIYAIESKDIEMDDPYNPGQTVIGPQWLRKTLAEVKDVAKELGIELIKLEK